MRVLYSGDAKKLDSRFDSFLGYELCNLEIKDPTTIELTIRAQDSLREYDWIEISFLCSDVMDASLPTGTQVAIDETESRLILKNLDNRFTLLFEDGYNEVTHYITCKNIKYSENSY